MITEIHTNFESENCSFQKRFTCAHGGKKWRKMGSHTNRRCSLVTKQIRIDGEINCTPVLSDRTALGTQRESIVIAFLATEKFNNKSNYLLDQIGKERTNDFYIGSALSEFVHRNFSSLTKISDWGLVNGWLQRHSIANYYLKQ